MDHQQMVSLRRFLHAHAEPGFMEYLTASTVIDELTRLGVPHRWGADALPADTVAVMPSPEEQREWADRARDAGVPAARIDRLQTEGTAVIAEIRGTGDGPTWGLRADMDALPVTESGDPDHLPAREGFSSRTPFMHACGHDGHTAIGLALLSRLVDCEFPGTLRVLFQPAEEGVRGAAPMIAAGAVDGIDRMLAVHLGGDEPVGTVIGGVTGALATTKWRTEFFGEPAHAAGAPEKGRNALAAAAQASLGLLGIARHSAADTRVNVGTFHSGGAANIVPAQAEISYETRATSNEALATLDARASSLVAGAAQMYDAEHRSVVFGSATSSRPDPALVDAVVRAAAEVPTISELRPEAAGPGGSDDAHLMIDAVQSAGGQGTYIMVGGGNPAPHHHHRFDVDEASLEIAADLLETLIRREA